MSSPNLRKSTGDTSRSKPQIFRQLGGGLDGKGNQKMAGWDTQHQPTREGAQGDSNSHLTASSSPSTSSSCTSARSPSPSISTSSLSAPSPSSSSPKRGLTRWMNPENTPTDTDVVEERNTSPSTPRASSPNYTPPRPLSPPRKSRIGASREKPSKWDGVKGKKKGKKRETIAADPPPKLKKSSSFDSFYDIETSRSRTVLPVAGGLELGETLQSSFVDPPPSSSSSSPSVSPPSSVSSTSKIKPTEGKTRKRGWGKGKKEKETEGEGEGYMIAFVNSKSGENQGITVFRKLQKLLGVDNVFDLLDGGPEPGLLKHRDRPGLRVLVCGGDGSICWVHSILDKMGLQTWPSLAILPLGTGNDLARALGWGGGYENESIGRILQQMEKASIVGMDRWSIVCTPRPVSPRSTSVSSSPPGGGGGGKPEKPEKPSGGSSPHTFHITRLKSSPKASRAKQPRGGLMASDPQGAGLSSTDQQQSQQPQQQFLLPQSSTTRASSSSSGGGPRKRGESGHSRKGGSWVTSERVGAEVGEGGKGKGKGNGKGKVKGKGEPEGEPEVGKDEQGSE
eukprot:CAMPEP_0201532506 /NCGR_PEP_ID=MMETSP0161_2-20130828/50561_1 /ASSEMBLY_ACC=CAM_ASM_000251 /TAXON_ID=180227 /ORGANISM="Neoparamoeba aestuarina, Strain SoJaBio B1-5/56/2" /LENGTH=564 /DNA_ID=CAMNT_0047935963 /DNA_START=255 /DNA_END=1946 /DNA_ORIENTATION=-